MIPIAAALLLGVGIFFAVRGIQSSLATVKAEAAARQLPVGENQGEPQEETTAAPDTAADTVEEKETTVTETVTADSSVVLTDVSSLVESVMPCVVAVTDTLQYTTYYNYNPYDYFFRGDSGSTTKEAEAFGSGVIYTEDDTNIYIVTNNHVVDNEGNYSQYSLSSIGFTVTFCDDTTAEAALIGTDEESDLAVLSVAKESLEQSTLESIAVATVGDSDALKIGEGVFAIGNALGYGQSVTSGIISAKDRSVTVDNITRSLLQTDAAINPGNSGGGLFDRYGRLVGINSAKTVSSDVEGMCFAIPINAAEDVIETIMTTEPVAEEDQGYIGINGETIPETYIESYGYPAGVSITRIGEGSPAEKAGLQIYDIITAVDGKDVTSMDGLKKIINGSPAGTTFTLTVKRPEGRSFTELEVQVTSVRQSDLTTETNESQTETEAPETESESDSGNSLDDIFDWLFNN